MKNLNGILKEKGQSTIQTTLDGCSINNQENDNNHIYQGISNQGATCYLNSLIQVLFHLKKFRQFIYEYNNEIDINNVKFCLQLLFRDLQNCRYRVNSKLLTNSIGNYSFDTRISQDVFEFYTFFLSFFKGAPSSLFEGEYQLQISDDNSLFEIIKKPFNSLLLTVENCESIMDSFQLFIAPYLSSETNFDNSICQNVFTKLPPVLTVVLKRFRLNEISHEYEKLDSIVVFPQQLNLEAIAPRCANSQYEVFAIISHIGTMDRGHYVVFINPDLKGEWYEFNDRKVRKTTKEDVYNLCYGVGQMNAYMIFYVNENSIEFLLENAITTIPDFVSHFAIPKVEKPSEKFFMNTEEGVAKNILKFKSEFLNFECRKQFSFSSGTKYKTAYFEICKTLNFSNIRLWTVRNNSLEGIIDPEERIKKTDTKSWLIQEIRSKESIQVDNNHIVVFLSFYLSTKLFYLGSYTFHKDQLISDIYQLILNKYLRKTIEMKSFLFSNKNIIPLIDSLSFHQASLLYNGVFIIVQEKETEAISLSDFTLKYKVTTEPSIDQQIKIINTNPVDDFHSADVYITYILNRVIFNVYNDKNKTNFLFTLFANTQMEPTKAIDLLSSSIYPGFRKGHDTILLYDLSDPSNFINEKCMSIMLQRGNHEFDLYFLIYKDVSSIDESNLMNLVILFNKTKIPFIINKNVPLKTIKQNLIDNNLLSHNKEYRFYLTHNSRIVSILLDKDIIPPLDYQLHVEEIPKYQLEEGILLVKVAQCVKSQDKLTFFGTPFFIGITFEEICLQVIERICSVLGCPADHLSILIEMDPQTENYRKLLDANNVFDALDCKDELFAFFS